MEQTLKVSLGVTGVFGLISASSPNFAAIGVFAALWSFGNDAQNQHLALRFTNDIFASRCRRKSARYT